jgi:uncharacterized membrane protein
MKTLAVWSSPTADGVGIALDRLRALAAERRIAIDDAAAVSWPHSRRRPELSEHGSLVGPGALWGGFWGLFVGLICVTPLAGLSFGAAAGAVAGSLADFGIDGVFIKHVRKEVVPGTSAVFVLAEATAIDRTAAVLGDLQGRLWQADLDAAQSRDLWRAFVDDMAWTRPEDMSWTSPSGS